MVRRKELDPMTDVTRTGTPPQADKQSGKVGWALLAWLLGVPGIIVLLFLFIF
jgi:hypothetical protein